MNRDDGNGPLVEPAPDAFPLHYKSPYVKATHSEEAIITAKQLKYIAGLVDWDTSGDQDDPLYLELMKLWNATEEDDRIRLKKV